MQPRIKSGVTEDLPPFVMPDSIGHPDPTVTAGSRVKPGMT